MLAVSTAAALQLLVAVFGAVLVLTGSVAAYKYRGSPSTKLVADIQHDARSFLLSGCGLIGVAMVWAALSVKLPAATKLLCGFAVIVGFACLFAADRTSSAEGKRAVLLGGGFAAVLLTALGLVLGLYEEFIG